jgi:DNA-binding SARP family transcriptional activator
LLAYLLVNREELHFRAELARLFWPELDERRAHHCLNTACWRLQRALGGPNPAQHPYLRRDTHTIGINLASDLSLDVLDFENRIQWANEIGPQSPTHASLLRHAVELYVGDLLADWHDEWCLTERKRLRQLYLGAVETLRMSPEPMISTSVATPPDQPPHLQQVLEHLRVAMESFDNARAHLREAAAAMEQASAGHP